MSEPSALRKEHILVVDDMLSNLELISGMLKKEGYQIEKAHTGEKCLEKAHSSIPDAILLDINMPEMDGYTVCSKLKSDIKTCDIPVIFISASDEVLDRVKAFSCGGSDYISKPFKIEEVLARIENQLSIRRLQTQLKAQKKELQIKNLLLQKEVQNRKVAETKLLKLNRRLKILASIDRLTKIPNRHCFDKCFDREWLRMKREQFPITVILCDIDHFKLYNDNLGHQAGDACLKTVAKAIAKTLKRPADLVARYGGEEFVIVLPKTDVEGGLKIAENVRRSVENLKLKHPQSSVSKFVTLSLGVCCVIPTDKIDKKSIIEFADKGLYEAKKQGRNQVILKSME